MNISHLVPERFRPPGFFYGWYIAIAGTLNNAFVTGITITSIGLFYEPMRQETGWSMTLILAGASLRSFEQGLLAPVTGMLIDRLGPRRMAVIGLTILAIGLFMLSQAYFIWSYYLASLVTALGQSLGGLAAYQTSVLYWFEKKRATAVGIVNSGFAFGYFVAPVLALGIVTFGWRYTVAAAGAFMLCVVMPLAFFVLRTGRSSTVIYRTAKIPWRLGSPRRRAR